MKREPVVRRLAVAVRSLRELQGLTQAALARRAGLSRSQILALERGDRASTIVTLEVVARALGLTGAELLAQARDGHGARRPDRADRLASRLRTLTPEILGAIERLLDAAEEASWHGKSARSH